MFCLKAIIIKKSDLLYIMYVQVFFFFCTSNNYLHNFEALCVPAFVFYVLQLGVGEKIYIHIGIDCLPNEL